MVLYLFMFYYKFLVNNVALITDRSLLQSVNITISSTNYQITTSNYYNFQTAFSKTDQSLASLQGSGLWCAIDGYASAPAYSSTLNS
jgi:hypothetical protein